MRILQIIDSLAAGGAERMAVNYANALTKKVEFSGLIATRLEGPLLQQLNTNVTYHFLNKKGSFDLKAVFRLKAFVKLHKITIIQAHSTSFFTGFLLKLICPSIQLIWHDHYGDSEFLHKRPNKILKAVLPFFSGIIAVNHKLKDWAKVYMHFNNTVYLPNFTSDENTTQGNTILKGIAGKRIVCLANLREQKNHFLLVEVARKLKISHPDWTFHLVGKDSKDGYANELKSSIVELELKETVFIYGEKSDISAILGQSTIGILTSKSEGLPVALLEYGLCKIAVVVIDVGEINSVIQNGVNGCMVPSQESELFYIALIQLVENERLRMELGNSLYQTILETYSEQAVITPYLNWLQTTILK
ncbi:glycosyltransferase [Flavobacterium sp. WC2409]|uniref:Glycosyltransferase n=1 Tax=Flavobacterium sp. WC2409 TaxID=3234139 RepID=A0AB39W360_9FLAO